MATLIFTNLTWEQAKCLAKWYEGQGEQDADVWFSEQQIKTPMVQTIESYKDLIIVHCRDPKIK